MNRLRGLILTFLCLLLICCASFLFAVDGEDFFKAGKKFYKKKQYDSAIEMFDAAIGVNSSYWEAMSWRIKTLGKQKEVPTQIDACYSMLAAMNKATDLSERDKKIKKKINRLVRKLDKAGVELKELVNDYIVKAMVLGNEAMEQKHYSLAGRIFLKIIELDKDNEIAKAELEKLKTLQTSVSLFDGRNMDSWSQVMGAGGVWETQGSTLVGKTDRNSFFVYNDVAFASSFEFTGTANFSNAKQKNNTSAIVGLVFGFENEDDDFLLVTFNTIEATVRWVRADVKPVRMTSLHLKVLEGLLSMNEELAFSLSVSGSVLILKVQENEVMRYDCDGKISSNGKVGLMIQNVTCRFADLEVQKR